MTKKIVTILLFLLTAVSYASDIVCVGTATQVVNGRDTLFIFKDEIHLRSMRGYVDWYRADGSIFASNTDEIYPDDGGFYIKSGTFQSAPVYTFLYSDPAADVQLTLAPDCNATTLTLRGDVDPFTYTRPDASTGTYARECVLHYTVLAWNGEEWADSAAHIRSTLHEGNYILPAFYDATTISLCYDPDVRIALGMDSACYAAELLPDDVVAVNLQLTSLATARGGDEDKTNERNRPTSQDLIQGSEYSGPLEVAFYSNPTPAVKYYRWAIYRGADLLITRQDRDIRYTFSEPGNYRVVCSVNNSYCQADSMEVAVTISSSYLAAPNVFTPNGDGVNDEFRVTYRSIREFHCWIYNRWGHLIYEWTDPSKGWDGTIGGKPAAAGAYFYVIRALGTDAATNAQYTAKAAYKSKVAKSDQSIIGIYQLSGDINLLR